LKVIPSNQGICRFSTFHTVQDIMSMFTRKINLNKTYTITPENSFISEINITGNIAQFKMGSKGTVYSYELTKKQINHLVKAGKCNLRLGKWYNDNLRGSSVSKTVFS